MKARGKTGSKGIHRRLHEQGQLSIVTNLYRTTIHNFHAQAPPAPLICTITEDLTATTESGTRPTPRPQYNVS
eukprot:539207-Amphidinium_carterae.4